MGDKEKSSRKDGRDHRDEKKRKFPVSKEYKKNRNGKDGQKRKKSSPDGMKEKKADSYTVADHRKSEKAAGKKEKAFRNRYGIQKIDWKEDAPEEPSRERITEGKNDGEQSPAEEQNESRIEGRNAVTEAFRAGRTIDRLYVLDGTEDGPVLTIKRLAAKAGTPIRYLSRQRMDQLSETGKHQGVIAVAAAYHYGTVDDLFRRAEEKGEDPFFILLDNIEDPHNLGAIIRTANVVGAHGVIIPKDRAVGLTATVAKASAGALNFTPVVKVTNMAQTIEELKKKGLWFVCADMDGTPMTKLNLTGPIGMVVGAEGEGVSRLVKEKCDIVAAIPQRGEINSLNASVAAGVLAYEILRQRG